MARSTRLVFPEVPYHITARGNLRSDVFRSDGDRALYLRLLARYCGESGVSLLGWCLMSNHVHLLAVPDSAAGLSKAVQRTNGTYALAFNRQYGRPQGHLWQGRFFSCPIGAGRVWKVLQYIETNPVRAGLAAQAWDWQWSSARAHSGRGTCPPMLMLEPWRFEWSAMQWAEVLGERQPESEFAELRVATRHGLPWGDAEFVRSWEERSGRSCEVGRRGRPAQARGSGVGGL